MSLLKRVSVSLILIWSFAIFTFASDKCHVYLIDREKAEQLSEMAMSAKTEKETEKIVAQYVTMFDEFETTFEEEATTTKVYKIPNSNLFVTASVFYTDEMLPGNSITLALAIGDKDFESALSAPPVVQVDTIYNDSTETIRAKTFITINQKSFAVGLQCDCNQPKK